MSSDGLLLLFTAALVIAVGCAHSYFGERYILIRLFRRTDLPKLFGDISFTTRTIRLAWHLTTIAWWAVAAILFAMAQAPVTSRTVGLILGSAFIASASLALLV